MWCGVMQSQAQIELCCVPEALLMCASIHLEQAHMGFGTLRHVNTAGNLYEQ